MQEAITESRIKKYTIAVKSEGDFEPFEEVKARYQDKPEEWANIEANAARMVCKVTKKDLICVPKHSLSISAEDTSIEERKRRIETDVAIKAPKVAKKVKVQKPLVDGEAEAEAEAVMPMKPISEVQQKRITSSIPKLEEKAHSLNSILCECAANEVKAWIPDKLIEAGQKVTAEIDECVVDLAKYLVDKNAPKGALTALFQKAKDSLAKEKEMADNFQSLLDMAKAGA